jgi:hypothetical protein
VHHGIEEHEQPEHAPQAQQLRQAREVPHRGHAEGEQQEVERGLAAFVLELLYRVGTQAGAEQLQRAADHPREWRQARDEHQGLVEVAIALRDVQKLRRRSMP